MKAELVIDYNGCRYLKACLNCFNRTLDEKSKSYCIVKNDYIDNMKKGYCMSFRKDIYSYSMKS